VGGGFWGFPVVCGVWGEEMSLLGKGWVWQPGRGKVSGALG